MAIIDTKPNSQLHNLKITDIITATQTVIKSGNVTIDGFTSAIMVIAIAKPKPIFPHHFNG